MEEALPVSTTQERAEGVERDTSVPPEVLLLGILGFGAWTVGLFYGGYAIGWAWIPGYLVVSVAGLFLWGHFDTSVSSEQQHRAERDRQLAELDDDIEAAGGLGQIEATTGQAPQVIQDLLARKVQVHSEYRDALRTAAWRSEPISAPRRVLRHISQTVLLVVMILLAVAWYGSMLVMPPLLTWMALQPTLGDLWALLPAGLVLPLGVWCAWWWSHRAPKSAVQAANVGITAGS